MMRRLTRTITALLLCALGMLIPSRSFADIRAQATPQVTGDEWDARFAAPAIFPEANKLVAGDGSLYYLSTSLRDIDRWDGTAIHTIGQAADGSILALAYTPGSLYASGAFTEINGVQAFHVARWDVATETWHGMHNLGEPYAILATDTSVYTVKSGGDSSVVERWDSLAQTWQTLATLPRSGFNTSSGRAVDLIMLNNALYISFNESPLGVVSIDLASNTWHSIVDQQQDATYYYELAASSSALYLGRSQNASLPAMIEVFSYDVATEALQPLGNLAGRQGRAASFDMLFAGGALFVAGLIDQAGTIPVNGVARWDGARWESPGGGPTPINGAPLLFAGSNLVADGQSIVVGGNFFSSDTLHAAWEWEPGLARWAPASGTWEPLAGAPTALSVDGWISALVMVGSDLYVGGQFRHAGTTLSRNLARLDTRTMTWHAIGAQSLVTALSARDDKLYVGYRGWRKGVEEINLRTGVRRSFDNTWVSCGQYENCVGVRFLAATASGLYAADGASLVYLSSAGWSKLLGIPNSSSNNSRALLFNRYAADDRYVYSANQPNSFPSLCNSSSRATIVVTRWNGAVGEDLPGGVSGPYRLVWRNVYHGGVCNLEEKPFVYGLQSDNNGLYIYGAFDQAGSAPANGWAYWSNQDESWQSRLLHPPGTSNLSLPGQEYMLAPMYPGNDGPVLVSPMEWGASNEYNDAPSLWEWRDGDWQQLAFAGSFSGPIASVGCDIYAGVHYTSPPWPVPRSGLARMARTCRAGGTIRTTRGASVAGIALGAGTAQAMTGDDGSYRFADLPDGSVTITPTQDHFVFEPPTRSVTFPTLSNRQDFTLLPAPVSTTLTSGQPASLSYTDVNGLPVALNVPAGASSAIAMTLAAAVPPPLSGLLATTGHAFELRVAPEEAAVFAHGLTLTIAYSEDEVRQLRNEAQLTLYRWDGQAWVENSATCAGTTQRDAVTNTFSTTLCGPGRYALVGPARGVALPLVMR